MLKMSTIKKFTFYAKHYMDKIERWQNFDFANERKFP